jgi:hypothetical protein
VSCQLSVVSWQLAVGSWQGAGGRELGVAKQLLSGFVFADLDERTH